jgi:hypothetical protein
LLPGIVLLVLGKLRRMFEKPVQAIALRLVLFGGQRPVVAHDKARYRAVLRLDDVAEFIAFAVYLVLPIADIGSRVLDDGDLLDRRILRPGLGGHRSQRCAQGGTHRVLLRQGPYWQRAETGCKHGKRTRTAESRPSRAASRFYPICGLSNQQLSSVCWRILVSGETDLSR